jgi:hypothetical protein
VTSSRPLMPVGALGNPSGVGAACLDPVLAMVDGLVVRKVL